MPGILYQNLRFSKDCIVKASKGILKRNRQIEKFKDIHKNKRCFIIATGPSLTIEDVEMLKDEITFSVNSCYQLFSKTTWRPTYYMISDNRVYKRIEADLKSIRNELNTVFCAEDVEWYDDVIRFNTTIAYQNIPERGFVREIVEKRNRLFMSTDPSKYIVSGHSVVYSAIQMAEYMGFSEIYLLGVDCNYSGAQQYSSLIKGTPQKRSNMADPMHIDYYYANKHFTEKTKVYNATRGGMLEAFPRKNFDEIFAK